MTKPLWPHTRALVRGLKTQLDDSEAALAQALGLSPKALAKVLAGHRPLPPRCARRLDSSGLAYRWQTEHHHLEDVRVQYRTAFDRHEPGPARPRPRADLVLF